MKKSIQEIITERFTKALDEGTIPWRKPWNTCNILNQSLFNMGKAYRGINQLLTWTMAYESPYWGTYKQYSEVGANVKAGERALPIVFFKFLESKTKVDSKGRPVKIPLMRYFSVFNVSQVENLKIDQAKLFPTRTNEFNPIERAEEIVKHNPKACPIEYGHQRACFFPSHDKIQMPSKESFKSPEEYYATLFHELIHSTGHESRLDRKSTNKDEFNEYDHRYSFEELVAEIGSAFLCAEIGISQAVLENQAAYIQNWSKVLKKDAGMVIKAAQQAQKAVDFILNKNATEYMAEVLDNGESQANTTPTEDNKEGELKQAA